MQRYLKHVALIAVFALTLSGAVNSGAAPNPSSDLLLPYFEVQLDAPGITTLFAVVNSSDEAVDIEIAIHSNWGIEVLNVPLTLEADQVQSVNLGDWLVHGRLPDDQSLSAEDVAHLQAALCGEASPLDGQYYSTEIVFRRAVGYVTVRSQGSRPDVLFGDYFVVDGPGDLAQGEQLVDIDRANSCGDGICLRHALRFLEGAAFDAGTELIIWTPGRVQPSVTPGLAAEQIPVVLDATAFEEPGDPLGNRLHGLLPVQVLRVADLAFDNPFGWLDLTTSEESWIGVRYTAGSRYSVALNTVCLPLELPPTPGLRIEKLTNGVDSDRAPGRRLPVGTEITWEYVVRNTGQVDLTDVVVTDDDDALQVLCPRDTLAAGESMVCSASGTAGQCGYVNVGTAAGLTADGARIADTDRSHYFGDMRAALDLELSVNGHDADQGPGPAVQVGDELTFVAVVTNSGDAELSGIELSTDNGLELACPRDSLVAGESMECTGGGIAEAGNHAIQAAARSEDACGGLVSDSDPTHYQTEGCPLSAPAVSIEKATNGHDADFAPGPEIPPGAPVTWTYVVTNTGDVALADVAVTDDDSSLTVLCPKSGLAVGESMTCTAQGVAGDGAYANVGTVSAVGGGNAQCSGTAVSDSDSSHYFNEPCPAVSPAVSIEKATNGHDADSGPGPQIEVGAPVTWTYVVTNSGDVGLIDVVVADDDTSLSVSCPQSVLDAGASMTCTAHGTAVEGPYSNVGSVSARSVGTGQCPGQAVSADDPSHYTGVETPDGDQGCTPGYWKNHTDSWPPTGYSPGQSVESVFSAASAYPAIAAASLLEALDFTGGSGVEGAARNLLRAATAALLDATHPGVDYPRSEAGVIADTNAALASGDRDTMLAQATAFDRDNNLGCPL